MNLKIDPARVDAGFDTGIMVRAREPGDRGAFRATDIAELDRASLLEWLRSRGGNNPYAEDVVGILLGHGHLHVEAPNAATEG